MEPLKFVPLEVSDAARLSQLLQSQTSAYLKHFHPFEFDESTIRVKLENRRLDQWWGLESGAELVGLLLLRGFDEGYKRPSFGVMVAEAHRGRGIAVRALQFSQEWAVAQEVRSIMLKVEPENEAAKRLYENYKFVPVGRCPQSNQLVYEWSSPAVSPKQPILTKIVS